MRSDASPPSAITALADDLDHEFEDLDTWLRDEGFTVHRASCLAALPETADSVTPSVIVAVLPKDRPTRLHHLMSFATIRAAHPSVGLMLVFQDAELPVYQAAPVVASGVGFVLSDSARDRDYLVSAIRHVACGGVVVDPNIMSKPSISVKDLGPRHVEVLELMATGLDNDAIALKLYISPRTVEGRIREIYERLRLDSADENRRVVAVLTYLRATGMK
ncbi:MAG: response regulator transcription factor [Marmoricola sp.]